MKEEDYVTATNLAKLQIAQQVMASLIVLPKDTGKHNTIVRLIYEMIDKLEKLV